MSVEPKRGVPKTRSDLLDCAAVIRRRLRTGNDPILKAFGFCAAGISHFYEAEYQITAAEACLLADATIQLVESYRG